MGVDLLSPLASLIAWRCIPEAGRSEIRRVGFATCNTFAGEFSLVERFERQLRIPLISKIQLPAA